MVETMYLNFWLAVDGTQTGVKMSWKDHKQQLGALAVLQRLLHDCAIHIGQDPSQAENLQELEGQLHVLREMERSIAVKSNTARRPPIHPLMQASADAASSAGAQGSKSESDEVQPARSHRFSGSNSHFVSELHAALEEVKKAELVDMDEEEAGSKSESDEVQPARSHRFSGSNSHFVSERHAALEEVKKAGLADMDEEEALVAPADTSELLECSDGRDDFRDEPGADFNALAQLIQQTRSSDRMVHRRVGHLLSPRTLPPRLYSIEEGDEDEGNSPRHAARATSTTGGSQIPGSRLKPPQGPPPPKEVQSSGGTPSALDNLPLIFARKKA
eukprot:CAMPEP_0197621788 /NCGR_PEP_ID=MMETSP1338-20131121/2251_1 /TAXON_ID=43686 ORGANISM="Pelagodinium beii, Strain RCC1491" /NCGR_SAMPLE_ID=MMETSP1338 /ASSEMBLY_ACC=CAM_ASM_000754 /LENGTH=330 /DNA_ID=CAMNT_0043191329 /DNA_START=55 /DNA_END=1045 /DNA_ORIENTATION=-